jgi:ABC-type transport system substrate-binding protein
MRRGPQLELLLNYGLIIKEEQPGWLKLQKGQLDVALIPKDNFGAAITASELSPELKQKGMRLEKSTEPVVWYLNFNMKDKVLGANANLRKAMAQAVDRKYWIDLFLNGRGKKATSMIPEGIAGHVERPAVIGDFNLDSAKALMVKAGYPEGKGLAPIRLDLRGGSPTQRQQGEYLQKALAQIGIQLQVEVNTFPAFLEKSKVGNLQFFLGGWSADYPDAENFMQLLYVKIVAPGPNDSNYVNKEFDALYEQFSVMAPSAARDVLIKKAEDIAFNDGVWSMLFYPIRYSIQQGWVKNYRYDAITTNYFKFLDVDNEDKAKTLKEKF